MDKRRDTSGAYDPGPLTQGRGNALSAAWTRVVAAGRDGLRDTIAGLVAAVVLIANIISFGALMFPGNLSDGMPIAIWAMLIGSSIGGVWIALRTSLPPFATGIDSPTGAVLVLLGASVGSGILAVLAGLLCACVMFTISYARLGVVRRHMTRAQFAGYVDRTAEAAAHLRENGDAIRIYWLSGYIFFGSSESMFERIRGDIEALPRGRVAYVILDFRMASGADSSAVLSLTKLRNFCDQQDTTLVYCSLTPANHKALELGGVFGGKSRHQAFADLNFALAWCEDRLLAKTNLNQNAGLAGFEPWLQHQLGAMVRAADLVAYLERKDTDGSQVLYREGEPADNVDLVAAGNLAIEITNSEGESLGVRRIMTHTVVGEMGFFRHSARSATVSSDGPATLFTLTRANFQRMRRERPDLASAFDDFILRVLADRIDFANHAIDALNR